MIIGVTHDPDGRVIQRLSVSTKVSIGLPPNGDRNHPTKLDHFVFLRKKKAASGVEWEPDPELTQHYGEQCREIHIMLIDDDIENVFPSSYAWWTATERKEKRKRTATIWALSLEVDGDDVRKLVANLTEHARLFAETRKLLGSGGKVFEVVEDEQEQGPEIVAEYYPGRGNGSPADGGAPAARGPSTDATPTGAPPTSAANGPSVGSNRQAPSGNGSTNPGTAR